MLWHAARDSIECQNFSQNFQVDLLVLIKQLIKSFEPLLEKEEKICRGCVQVRADSAASCHVIMLRILSSARPKGAPIGSDLLQNVELN